MYVIIEFFMDCGGEGYYVTVGVAKFCVWVWDSDVSFGEVR